MNENRVSVKGYEGLYEVDSNGDVFGLDRIVNYVRMGKKLSMKIKGRKLKQCLYGKYKIVPLSKDGVLKTKYVHRVVAESFIENPESKREVNHIDSDKTNNKLNNLEWATPSENRLHALKNHPTMRLKGYSNVLEKEKLKSKWR